MTAGLDMHLVTGLAGGTGDFDLPLDMCVTSKDDNLGSGASPRERGVSERPTDPAAEDADDTRRAAARRGFPFCMSKRGTCLPQETSGLRRTSGFPLSHGAAGGKGGEDRRTLFRCCAARRGVVTTVRDIPGGVHFGGSRTSQTLRSEGACEPTPPLGVASPPISWGRAAAGPTLRLLPRASRGVWSPSAIFDSSVATGAASSREFRRPFPMEARRARNSALRPSASRSMRTLMSSSCLPTTALRRPTSSHALAAVIDVAATDTLSSATEESPQKRSIGAKEDGRLNCCRCAWALGLREVCRGERDPARCCCCCCSGGRCGGNCC